MSFDSNLFPDNPNKPRLRPRHVYTETQIKHGRRGEHLKDVCPTIKRRPYSRRLRGTTEISIGFGKLVLPYTLIRDEVAGVVWYEGKIDTMPGVRACGRTMALAKENISIAAVHFIEECYRLARLRGWRPPRLAEGTTMIVPTSNARTARIVGGIAAMHTRSTRKGVIRQAGYASGYLPGYPVRASVVTEPAVQASENSGKDRDPDRPESTDSINGGSSALPPNASED